MVNKALCDRHTGRTPSPSPGTPCSNSTHFLAEDRRCVVSPTPECSRSNLFRYVGKTIDSTIQTVLQVRPSEFFMRVGTRTAVSLSLVAQRQACRQSPELTSTP